MKRLAVATVVLGLLGATGCGEGVGDTGASGGGGIDPTPEKLDGSSSTEFEAEDIERASNASEAVKEYCSGAVSEAQEVGCLSHVDESEIP